MADLSVIPTEFAVGAHITVTGVDTRGYTVTRAGYLLAPPKKVDAQRDKGTDQGIRLCVGPTGTDPARRFTWMTVFSDLGAVTHSPVPDLTKWSMTHLRLVPGVSARHHTRIVFGGRGGARSTEPTQATAVTVFYTDDGIYDLLDTDTDTVQLSCRLSTPIWWAPISTLSAVVNLPLR
ncbi:hypothetical protein ACIG3E_32940 [Streptomyces sp. NPDC053474]|uniref:hypothetical protein n=1 Tax=Streptomyces sp. NPDC053474 TaxID=3365704 RepID=UPI0037D5DAFF